MAANAVVKFIAALQSLVRQGLSKQAAEQFAKNEFGEISKFLQKRIDDVYKNPKGEGIESIKIKDEVFDDTVIKLPIDDTGQPFNPNNPLKEYGKPKKAGKGQFTKAEYLIQRLKNTIKENPDDKYVQENFPNFVKEIEANPDLAKNENVFKELGGDLPSDQKITVYDDDTLDFARLKPTKKFQLNKERFQKDFNVADDEVERIIKLSSEDQQKELQKYINKDFKERIELSDYDITDLEPNADGGRAGFYMGGQSTIEPDLSDIGHGSDSLMARTRLTAPGSQATTSTGLNYLLGEDNDNTRIPFNEGLLVPPAKPYTENMFEKDSMTLLKGMYGTGPDSNKFLYNEMIKKGNMLRNQGVERETVIEIIRKNKNKINAFLETQTGNKKSFDGLESFEMKADGGRIGYKDKGKVSLSDLESLQGLKKAREKLDSEGGLGALGGRLAGRRATPEAQSQRSKILDKAIAKFSYAVDNLDQETREKVISAFNDQLKIGYETTMSGLKMDAAEKVGFVPIDKETIYKAIVDIDLSKKTKLKMKALSDTAGSEELEFSLVNNNLGITYDNQSQTLVGKYNFNSKDGKLSITPSITKDQDSQIQSKIEIDKAIDGGNIDLDVQKDTTDNSLTTDFSLVKDGNVLSAQNVSGGDNNYFKAEGTAEVPLYMLKDGETPYISSEYYKDKNNGYDSLYTTLGIPITQNLEASVSSLSGDGMNTNRLGVNYKKYIDNIFTKNKSLDTRGTFNFGANIDSDNNKYAGFEIAFPLGKNKTNNMQGINFDNEFLTPYDQKIKELEELNEGKTMLFDGKKYRTNNIYSGSDLKELIGATKENFKIGDFIGPKLMADGGIAGLRQGYSKGKGVDLARRGFLKVLGATAAGVAAFKSGVLKVLGKTEATKAVPKIVEIGKDAGAPSWFEPMVNKVLADGLDVTKKNAVVDGQTVKRLDTPNGKVDVYHNERTGEIDVDYMGSGTALDEGVQMNYKPGISMADEGNPRPADEFFATESVPEGRTYGPDDYEIEMGENTVSNVTDLYSDTLELEKLGGQNPLIKDISNSINKKRKIKQMNDNPMDFIIDKQGDYDPT